MHDYATTAVKTWVVGIYCRYTYQLISSEVYSDFRTAKTAQIERLKRVRLNDERVLVTCEKQ